AEDRAHSHASALGPLRRGDLLGFLALHLCDLDLAALAGDAHARVADLGHLADLALHRAEGAHHVLLRAEELQLLAVDRGPCARRDRKSTRLNSSHGSISYAVFCLKKKNKNTKR